MIDHDIKTITLKEYDQIPIIYTHEGVFDGSLKLEVGDYFIMREPKDYPDRGSVISVYEIIRLTETGHESMIRMLRIE